MREERRLAAPAAGDAGTFGDLMEDCVTGPAKGKPCSFITNTAPAEVYGKKGNP